MARDQYKYFRLEARELLDRFGKTILDIEGGQAGLAQIQLLLRLAHTLKGAARVVKQPEIADHSHKIEDVLSPYRERAESLPAASISALLGHLDEIRRRVEGLAPPAPVAPAQDSGPALDENLKVVRADLSEMDALLESVSETHTLLNGLRPSADVAEQARHLADLLVEQLGARNGGRTALDGRSQRIGGTAEELRRSLSRLERDIGDAIDQMDRELRQLRESAEQLRLVSASSVFAVLERTVRDAAQALSKRVVFESEGGGLRLDAHVLGIVQPALVQIVRNAVAHGIESEEERQAKSKPVPGRIAVTVHHRAGKIFFSCRDDGRGVNLEAVRRAAIRRGLSEQQAAGLKSGDLLRLLLEGGLSTSDSVTPIAGRGIGLDIVREAVTQLGGTVAFHSDQHGTRFDLVMPMSLSSFDALVVDAGGVSVALPLDAVRGSVRLAADQISLGQSTPSVVYDGVAYPFLSLSAALLGKPPTLNRTWQGLLVAGPAASAIVGADRLLGTSRIVTRPLPKAVPASEIVSATWLDAEGNPQLVLDAAGLVAMAGRASVADIAQTAPARPVLIVDDSLTSRMLEQSILESAGFDVDAAASAEEALEVAHNRRYALFLVDVEMPGMTGFDFVERIRADPELRDIPAIMITSRSTPEDLARGREVGAQGYMVKSEFDQVQLLSLIQSLVG